MPISKTIKLIFDDPFLSFNLRHLFSHQKIIKKGKIFYEILYLNNLEI